MKSNINPNIQLVVGSAGDVIIYQGPATPAFFVPAASVAEALTDPQADPGQFAITSRVAIAIVGVLLSSLREIKAIPNLPNEIGKDAIAFRIWTNDGYSYAYVSSPKTVQFSEWLGEQGIHIVVTPSATEITGLGKSQPGYHDCPLTAFWEEMHGRLGRSHVMNIAGAWRTARSAFRDCVP